jgi:hypothetical protein
VRRVFRYPVRALAADYARSGAGTAILGGLLALASPAAAVGVPMAAAAALFLVYFARTVCRHLTQIELDETGIGARGPLGAEIRWDQLRSVRLDYYSTRGDREEGWMQLRLADARRTLRVESSLEGFEEVVRAAARQAASRDIALDAASLANLRALGG